MDPPKTILNPKPVEKSRNPYSLIVSLIITPTDTLRDKAPVTIPNIGAVNNYLYYFEVSYYNHTMLDPKTLF